MSDLFSRPTNSDYLNAINATKIAIDNGATNPTAIPTGYTLLYSSTQDPVNAASAVGHARGSALKPTTENTAIWQSSE
jgi:hypothetical protein